MSAEKIKQKFNNAFIIPCPGEMTWTRHNSMYFLSMNLLTVPDNWLFELICFSSNWLARPLWSPLINWLELFIDVQWSGNQFITPIGLLVFKSNMFNWETIWSVLCLYLEIIIEEKAWLQKRLMKWGMNNVWFVSYWTCWNRRQTWNLCYLLNFQVKMYQISKSTNHFYWSLKLYLFWG